MKWVCDIKCVGKYFKWTHPLYRRHLACILMQARCLRYKETTFYVEHPMKYIVCISTYIGV